MRSKVSSTLTAMLLTLGLSHCASPNWPTYRYTGLRQGNQPAATALSDPTKVPSLAVRWTYTPPAGGSFYASPIVVNKRVFIGSSAGYLYALNASTGALLWQYPAPGHPLVGTCAGDPPPQTYGQYGVMSSAAYFEGLVIFGAPDPDPATDSGRGSGRLWALKESDGSLVWKSDVVAHVSGCNPGALAPELHERIAYSSPLVFGRSVYVGVHDAGDSPIQNGKVMAVSVDTGHLIPGFSYSSTSSRGGGVWNGPATDLGGVLFTTGNTRCDSAGCQGTCDAIGNPSGEPSPNRGLSIIKLDPSTGNVNWQFQAVPYCEDNDPDWAAGVTVMLTSCGVLAASVEKDGWSYALDTTSGSCRWQFPPTAGGSCKFPKGTNALHGDTDYKRPGAAWNDVLVINTGGEALVHDGVGAGYGRLHALNACATDELHRVRWLVDVPHSSGSGYSIGAPTVTGGVVYVTTDEGHVVALADPSIVPAAGYRCSDIDFVSKATCTTAGYAWVPIPKVLADVPLDGTSAAGLRNEAAIAAGKLYVGTVGGHIYMLSP
jgi:outer membrane protein assembly factor BamB